MTAIDWDRGGHFIQSQRVWLGNSVGWAEVAGATLAITSPGTVNLAFGFNLVTINVAGLVTLNLPSGLGSKAGPLAQPASHAIIPLMVVDIGGHSASFPVTINAAPSELIGPVASVQIATNFGAIVLRPNISSNGWSVIS